MEYNLDYTDKALSGMEKLKRSEPKAFNKLGRLLHELIAHPTFGTGHPELLSGNLAGKWSRQISKKHRLVYEIHGQEVTVLVLSAYGHYDDK